MIIDVGVDVMVFLFYGSFLVNGCWGEVLIGIGLDWGDDILVVGFMLWELWVDFVIGGLLLYMWFG